MCHGSSIQAPVFQRVQTVLGKCQYQIRWYTCHVCPGGNPCHESTTYYPGGSTTARTGSGGSGGSSSGSSKHSNKSVVTASVIVVVVVVVLGIYFSMGAERRARILPSCSSQVQPQYKYQKVGDIELGKATDSRRLLDGETEVDVEEQEPETDEDDTLLAIN